MIIVGDVPVGKSHLKNPYSTRRDLNIIKGFVKLRMRADCKVCAQLHQSDSNMAAMIKYIPGVLTKKISMMQLRELLNKEVEPYITKADSQSEENYICIWRGGSLGGQSRI